MPQITLNDGMQGFLDRFPDECPICHSKISPAFFAARRGPRLKAVNSIRNTSIEAIFICPSNVCQRSFISYYEFNPNQSSVYINSLPTEPETPTFEPQIVEISESFCQIYTDSAKAEALGLNKVCGVGYRKSLEFLIKDYLIKNRPHDEKGIKSAPLGTCIENYIDDNKIKTVARLATWLGNDETHYERKWLDKDLSDLKRLINLVVRWIDTEYLTAEAVKSMPVPKKS